jgi:hypothetical protein
MSLFDFVNILFDFEAFARGPPKATEGHRNSPKLTEHFAFSGEQNQAKPIENCHADPRSWLSLVHFGTRLEAHEQLFPELTETHRNSPKLTEALEAPEASIASFIRFCFKYVKQALKSQKTVKT